MLDEREAMPASQTEGRLVATRLSDRGPPADV